MNNDEITQKLENIKRSRLQGEKLQQRLTSFIRQLSITANGDTTVLYAGRIDHNNTGISTADISRVMAGDGNIKVIDKTIAAQTLDNNKFKYLVAVSLSIQGKNEKQIVDKYENLPYESELGKQKTAFMFDGTQGLWAKTSKRFAEATTKVVRIMTVRPRPDSVLLQTEIPTLIDGITQNNSLTSVNGISADTLRDIYHDANVTDKKQALSNIMLLSGSKHTRLTLSPKLEAKQYGYRLKVELL
jgi:hypothetical protein